MLPQKLRTSLWSGSSAGPQGFQSANDVMHGKLLFKLSPRGAQQLFCILQACISRRLMLKCTRRCWASRLAMETLLRVAPLQARPWHHRQGRAAVRHLESSPSSKWMWGVQALLRSQV